MNLWGRFPRVARCAGNPGLSDGIPLGFFAAHGDGAQRVEARGRRLDRDVVVLRLIRQRHEVVSVLLGKIFEASANHLNANRLGGSME